MRHFFVYVFCVFWIQGCMPEHKLENQSILLNEMKKHSTKTKHRSIQGERKSNKDDGIYILDNGKIYIKTDGRSIVSIIDELAFKLRFNYLIATPLPKQRLAIYDRRAGGKSWKSKKGMEFDSISEVLDFLEQFLNYAAKNTDIHDYHIKLNDDGIVITSSVKKYKSSYKKIFLYNLTVDEAKKSLQEFFFKENTTGYSLLPLPAQNAIIIKSDMEILNQVGEIIYSIDSDAPQVMLEAEVFEYHDTVGRKVGMAIDYANINGNFALGVKTVFGETISDLVPQISGKYTNEEKKLVLLSTLALEDKDGGVKILAEPRLILKPGKEASIKLKTEKYIIVTGVNSSTLEQIDTGITFSITPVILSQSTILLKLHLEQSEFIPSNEDLIVQSTNKNLIDTSVVVHDGELVSLGGIYLSKGTKFSSGIPLLKDIPGAGVIFGKDSQDSSRTMIEFMIRPTIKKLHSRMDEIKNKTYRTFYQEYVQKRKKDK